ncbi:hypothetical protein ACWDKQ_05150, partial [Saccharopolyspora sp. NPDC000995]
RFHLRPLLVRQITSTHTKIISNRDQLLKQTLSGLANGGCHAERHQFPSDPPPPRRDRYRL